ncbi:MAG: hypothetical protein MJE68_09720 [Proteobacteria bacterium]|nr:hypothetical protein [Pseudomonadota bacterium]
MQEEYECLGPIPGVHPQFLTPDAFTSLPLGYLLGPDVARGPNTDFEPVDTCTSTEPKSTGISPKKSKRATTGVSSGPVEIHVDEGEIKGPTQLAIQDIEGAGGEMERGAIDLKPPAELFNSPQMHPLHIFVSIIILLSCITKTISVRSFITEHVYSIHMPSILC